MTEEASPTQSVDSMSTPPPHKFRLLNRDQPVHHVLGGGLAADVLLWRKKHISGSILGVGALLWYLFEHSGYTLLTLLSNTLLLLVILVFVWTQVSSFLNRGPPPIPDLKLSEDVVQKVAENLRVQANDILNLLHTLLTGRNYQLFLKVTGALYAISTVGSYFNFLTLVFLGLLAAFTLPVIYEKYDDKIDDLVHLGFQQSHKYYILAESKVKSLVKKIPHDKKQL